jgi:hypothetical protein
VGQTPWSARDALVPLSARRINALHTTMADEGVRPQSYGTITIGARQKANFCAAGSSTLTWQV